jgi:hypothetical protein
LESRREVGIILCDTQAARQISKTFESDWGPGTEQGAAEEGAQAMKVAQKVAKAVTKGLPPVGPVLVGVVEEVMGGDAPDRLDIEELELTVKETIRETVKDLVQGAVEEEHREKETVGRR